MTTTPPPEIADEHPAAAAARLASVEGTDAALRLDGSVMPPHVHFFFDDREEPYGGHIRSRPYQRGEDAAEAVARLGLLPSVLRADRILVVWEHCDLHVALEAPEAHSFPFAVMSVEATPSTELTIGHAFELDFAPGTPMEPFTPTIPQWGSPKVQTRYRLPAPITRLIELWLEPRAGDPEETMDALQEEGYRIALAVA
ncbi:hypothetical protein AB0I28_13330 [Phytomonospora sp. NPDC050363]|uniref:hypothetical protein n=1 Tax=Phytomonospora sp. NPDC050363 TaxID=3155642 RepID=UPI0033CA694B